MSPLALFILGLILFKSADTAWLIWRERQRRKRIISAFRRYP